MNISWLPLTGYSLTFFFAAFALVFFVWERRLSDFRTLRVGRLRILAFASLLLMANTLFVTLIVSANNFDDSPWLYPLAIEWLFFAIFPTVFGIVFPIFVLVLTIQIWRKEGPNLANLLLPILMFFFLGLDIIYIAVDQLNGPYGVGIRIFSLIFPVLSLYFFWQFFVFFVSSLIYGKRSRNFEAKAHVILGAGLINGRQVGRLLANRIRAGLRNAEVNTRVIMSGGKGSDERLSEAQAMTDYAIKELGFPSEQIEREERSTTTYENLIFSAKMLNKIGEAQATDFLFFTSDFHVFRAALFAKRLNLHAQGGISGKTVFYYRVPAFLREFIAVLNSQRKRHMVFVAVVISFFVLFGIAAAFLTAHIL